ncbi:MAG TPA: response regulator, partial [Planctomycetota bacterium]|nr:response regulator [Planctomycetota bacterium]
GATLKDDRRAIGRAAAEMDEAVRRARLLPFAEACEALDRSAREVARERGKEIELAVEGASIEIDRSILEGLKDPLVCLVRNAADHGIEAPDARRRAGKAGRGRIVVAAAVRGARIEVSVGDDGAGIDLGAVRETARRRGLPEPRDERECVRLLFEPGFSTAATVTEISGRGVGLDIVKSRVEAMRGSVDVHFEAGRGMRIALSLPATLTTMRAVLVSAGGETFAVPGATVERIVRLAPAEVKMAGGREVVPLGDGPPVPVASMARLLSLPERGGARSAAGKVVALLVQAGGRAALSVDDVLAEREVLVKPLGPRMRRLRGFAGATILETGRISLILGAAELVRTALERPGEPVLTVAPDAPAAKRRRILLCDDSATTRSLERAILEAAGYDVVAAVDGEEGWRILQEREADLVVSDVDMPRMNGIALCKAIRGSRRFRDLPVVLVTSLDSEQDRARGGEAGADAYIVKSGFDQRDLVRTVASLLGGGGAP